MGASGARLRVVICDDHPAFARGLASLLGSEAADLEVAGVAASGEEAVGLVADLLPDCVLMDLRMPGADGTATTRRVREVSPTTTVVVLTVSDEADDLYAALRAGASGYVVKDRDVAEIAGAVRATCRGQLVIPAHLVGAFLHDLDGSAAPGRNGEGLNAHEREILTRIGRGETNRQIASAMHVSERTIRRRVEDLYAKLHLADRIEAAVYATHHGLVRRSTSAP